MPDINIEADLISINEQIVKVVDELNKVNTARENLIQQVQNLNGVAMYLRGKIQDGNSDAPKADSPVVLDKESDDLERKTEYPEDSTT